MMLAITCTLLLLTASLSLTAIELQHPCSYDISEWKPSGASSVKEVHRGCKMHAHVDHSIHSTCIRESVDSL